jgi:hypothetical protein
MSTERLLVSFEAENSDSELLFFYWFRYPVIIEVLNSFLQFSLPPLKTEAQAMIFPDRIIFVGHLYMSNSEEP